MADRAWEQRAKRAFDVTVAATGLLVSSPILVGAALTIRTSMGSPVFFRQQRPGLGGELFEVVKFRTMTDGPGADASRLTPLGSRLRSLSVDELPQLWNVLRGDMSLVGPRPLLPEYLPLYNERQRRRHEVRPGITGLAQVNGRNLTTWPERLELDACYVDDWSMSLDIRILLDTARTVVRREGVSADDHATMPRFTGRETPLSD